MSKIGRKPIQLEKDIKVEIKSPVISIEGLKGKLEYRIPDGISIRKDNGQLIVERTAETKQLRSFHGLVRALVSNMVEGTGKGFTKELEIVGVGYKAQIKGDTLVLNVGFSHLVEIPIWKTLKVSCPALTRIVISGIDKQKVGEFSARIRRIMPPEPYKGKGIRYAGEQVRKKLGKAMTKG